MNDVGVGGLALGQRPGMNFFFGADCLVGGVVGVEGGVAGGVAIVSPAMQSDRCRWGRLDKLRLAALKGQTGKHVRQHVYNGLSLTLCACRPTSNHETWGGRAAPH